MSLKQVFVSSLNIRAVTDRRKKVVLILLVVLIESSLSEHLSASCNPDNRECSCADTSSRVPLFSSLLILSSFGVFRGPVQVNYTSV